jgi:hypothetical protein
MQHSDDLLMERVAWVQIVIRVTPHQLPGKNPGHSQARTAGSSQLERGDSGYLLKRERLGIMGQIEPDGKEDQHNTPGPPHAPLRLYRKRGMRPSAEHSTIQKLCSFCREPVRTLRDPNLETGPFTGYTVLPDRNSRNGKNLAGQKETG